MKILAASLLALLVAAAPAVADGPAGSAAPPAEAPVDSDAVAIAQRVQAFYDATQIFKADFQQSFFVKATRKTKDSRGVVTFKKPGFMSWRYTSNGNRVVSDGSEIKVYEAENQQMFIHPIADSQYPAALAFLMGKAKLLDEFSVRKMDAAAMKFEGGYVLQAIPKKPTAMVQSLFLFVDGGTAQVRRVILLDAQGNRNQFTFENPVVNEEPPKDEFSFEPPPGTTVIRP